MPETPFPHLFSPLALRHKTLKHRLNLGAHTANITVKASSAESLREVT